MSIRSNLHLHLRPANRHTPCSTPHSLTCLLDVRCGAHYTANLSVISLPTYSQDLGQKQNGSRSIHPSMRPRAPAKQREASETSRKRSKAKRQRPSCRASSSKGEGEGEDRRGRRDAACMDARLSVCVSAVYLSVCLSICGCTQSSAQLQLPLQLQQRPSLFLASGSAGVSSSTLTLTHTLLYPLCLSSLLSFPSCPVLSCPFYFSSTPSTKTKDQRQNQRQHPRQATPNA
ncbi:hypothetical protein IWX90DRAFT_177067 [Phyllosticta citrichinensis]|uniref:Uncharacterized protein n=1 Tax=Phyllosticta citrichinensis TaxID=1130410 RepID=A0ABR1XVW2_9PEZI